MKDVKGYEGLYAVTSCGRVWSYRNNCFLNPSNNGKGYKVIALCKDGEQKNVAVHRLVAEAYIPNPDNLDTVDHINGVKTDNSVTNLQWMTRGDNAHKGKGNDYKILCLETGDVFNSQLECSEKLGVMQCVVSEVLNGKRYKSTHGYHFRKI